MSDIEQHLVAYADGSCNPNPGHAGYGVFGYLYSNSERPKNHKHPFKANLFFTRQGVLRNKDGAPLHVHSVLEVIYSVRDPNSSNNYAELQAVLHTLRWLQRNAHVRTALIHTDSNYLVRGYNEYLRGWQERGYRRQDGKEVAHAALWQELYEHQRHFADRVKIQWIKAHNGDYGNEMADLFSVVGSTAARVRSTLEPQPCLDEQVLERELTYAQYKDSYAEKDFIYHFKDLFFSSAPQQDSTYCFISTAKDEGNIGRRSSESIFVANIGYVPEVINRIKAFYRAQPRFYLCTCSIKLSNFDDRDMLRLMQVVPVEFMLEPGDPRRRVFTLIKSKAAFLQENVMDYPFIANINRLSSLMEDVQANCYDAHLYDITSEIVQDGKLRLGNKDRHVELQEHLGQELQLTQKLSLSVGYDLPSYLALKRIEGEIKQVKLLLSRPAGNNFYTAFTCIHTAERQICSLNVPDKYLGRTAVNIVSA